jgi:hypothetical protein
MLCVSIKIVYNLPLLNIFLSLNLTKSELLLKFTLIFEHANGIDTYKEQTHKQTNPQINNLCSRNLEL